MTETLFSLRPSVITTEVGGEAYLLDIDSGLYLRASGAGSAIITHLSQAVTASIILSKILEEYDISEAEAETEICAFIAELEAAGMLERRLLDSARPSST